MIASIPYLFEKTTAVFSNKKAVLCGKNSITFSDLYQKTIATAHALKDLNIRKGDRVGVCMSKNIDQVISILGIMYANAVIVPILPKLKKSNISHIIQDCGMKALITDSYRIEEVALFSDKTKILIGDGNIKEDYPSLPYFLRHIAVDSNFFDRIGKDNAAIIYSSGSTGRPKGIVVSHRNLFDGARIVSSYLNTTPTDRIAGILSLNFDYGLNQLWQTLYKGASLYLHDLVFPNDFFNMIFEEKITALPLMPVIITRMFDPRFYKPNPAYNASEVKYICSSGGNVSQKMIQNLKNQFPKAKIYLMYGLTEAFRSTYLPYEQIEHRPNSIGKSIPDVGIYVLDKDENICPPGVPGELVHRGACLSKGYWNDKEKTDKHFREISIFPGEKVLFSGDIVKTDMEGYLYFVERGDNIIKTHGYRVSPTEIEEEANNHEKLMASVAFGIDNIEIGQDIVLVYETIDGMPVDENKFIAFLKRHLPTYMLPRFFIHMEQFPSTGNQGKIDRLRVKKYADNILNIENK